MGGYGALLLAERISGADAARRTTPAAGAVPAVAAVAAMSPAIFATYADARSADAQAFDSQADFTRNDVFAGISALRRVPTWVTCGADDPFQPQAGRFAAQLAAVTRDRVPGGIIGGCHDDAFWLRNLPAALSFIEGHLA
jgi:pimeloyl-ACP methyl ester carboxylesterase